MAIKVGTVLNLCITAGGMVMCAYHIAVNFLQTFKGTLTIPHVSCWFNLIVMTKDGYPSTKELKLIKEWDSNDFIGLIEFIKTIWAYPKDTIITNWYNDSVLGLYLRLELITSGLSGNESIIHALEDNVYMHHMWYAEWYVGGHHVWKIYPSNCGFKLVSDYCKEKGISRQAIHKNKNKYKFIIVSKNKRLIKLAKTSN